MSRISRNVSSTLVNAGGILQPWKFLSRLPTTRTNSRTIATVPTLKSWETEAFRQQAFNPAVPAKLPSDDGATLPAITEWFCQRQDPSCVSGNDPSSSSRINHSFWTQYSHLVVPLEITRKNANDTGDTDFDRFEGPLSLLLKDLEVHKDGSSSSHSVYLAQHDLRDLPLEIQADLPTPDVVHQAGKGDLYSSSLWLGRSPTYTPLHRDPNPNLLVQLAGTKVVRLFAPQIGDAIFEHAQQLVNHQRREEQTSSLSSARSASFRGEEMMKGPERAVLHDLVWADAVKDLDNNTIMDHAQDATLEVGQALFIPKGWWHSVKGVGGGVTASANWWFR